MRRRQLFLLVLTVALLAGIVQAGLPTSLVPGGGVTVGTGVIFRPSQSWVDLSLAAQLTFQDRITVGSTWVALDNVSLAMQKTPPGLPRTSIVLTGWAPWANANQTAITFTGSGAANSTIAVNVTGLRADLSYDLYVDDALQSSQQFAGGLSFSWSTSSPHSFDIAAFALSDINPPSSPPPPPPVPDTTPPATAADLRADSWGPDYVVLKWTAPGNDGNVGQASTYDVRYTSTGPLTTANFANATSIPMTPPLPAGSQETLNVTNLTPGTEYWFALRTADAVPNWSPLSDVADAKTLTSWVGVPSVNGIAFDPFQGQLQIAFSEPMNQTSVQQAVAIYPAVPFNVTWHSGSELAITLQGTVQSNTTYFLTIQPQATDLDGIPLARNFTFKFVGPPTSQPVNFLGLPSILFLPLLAGIVASGGVATVAVVRLSRSRKRMRALRAGMALLARRVSANPQIARVRQSLARSGPPQLGRERAGPLRRKGR